MPTVQLIFCLMLTVQIQCARILFMSLTPSPSHTIWDKTIALALRDRGHEITFVSPVKETSSENFTVIFVEGVHEKLVYNHQILFEHRDYESLLLTYDWFNFICSQSLQSNGIQILMHQVYNNVKYDLIFFDLSSGQCLYPVIEKFKFPPVIGTSAFGQWPFFPLIFGNDISASYVPNPLIPYTDEMSILQKLYNYLSYAIILFWHHYLYMPTQQKHAEGFFGEEIQSIIETEKHISLVLLNTDPYIDYAEPLPPNMLACGGLNVKRSEHLPENLQRILDSAKNGIIYFSFGTHIQSDMIEEKIFNNIMEAFSKLNQTILWKFESDVRRDLPDNVILQPWFPQNSVLAHPNVKLFISHGGKLSIQEAFYSGVPILGIPFFSDQRRNMEKIIKMKCGIKIDYYSITSYLLMENINEILSNPIYERNMKDISRRYKGQPQKALELAVYWSEEMLRHGAAQFHSTRARAMHFYQIYNLDIIGLLLFLLAIVYLLYRKIFDFLVSNRTSKLKFKSS